MKRRNGLAVVAVVVLVLSASFASGAPVEVIGDLNVTSKLGIGTATPNEPVHIQESAAGLSYTLKLDNQDPTIGDTTTGILFSTGGSGADRGKGAFVYETTGTWNRGSFHFLQEPSANMANPSLANSVLTVRNNGNVGIGIKEPGSKLDVSGWIRAKTGYGDSISIGGDTVGNDIEIQISAPAERNKISLWNAQLQTGVDLGVRSISAENLQLTGSIATPPKTSYISVPPPAFHLGSGCRLKQWNYQSNELYIYHEGVLDSCRAFAPVNLPHGATVTKFTTYWYVYTDGSASANASLYRTEYVTNGTGVWMGFTGPLSGRENGMRVIIDTNIEQPLIDNEHYGYYVQINIDYDFEQWNGEFFGAVIEYTCTSP